MAAIHVTEAESHPITTVIPARHMPDDIFIRHMNKRHIDSIGGLSELMPGMDSYVMGLYRSYHNHLHGILAMYHPEMDHEHDG